MDEKELNTLFQAAPGEPPPPTFDLADVTAASARVTARRRSALLATISCVVLALIGIGVTRLAFTGTTSPADSAQVATGQQPGDDGPGFTIVATPSPPFQGSGDTRQEHPLAESLSGCDKVDPDLAAALAGQLPGTEVAGPSPGRLCAEGSRSAGFQISVGAAKGFVSVLLVPPGAPVPPEPEAIAVRAPTPGGGTLVVSSDADPGSQPPLQDELSRIAYTLAGRF